MNLFGVRNDPEYLIHTISAFAGNFTPHSVTTALLKAYEWPCAREGADRLKFFDSSLSRLVVRPITMDTLAFLDHLRKLPFYQDQIVHREYIPPREARYQQLKKPLQSALQAALEASRLLPLYSHQAAAIDAARSGKNVILSTPSASGKTLCYTPRFPISKQGLR